MTPVEHAWRALRQQLGDRARADVPLGPLTTYRVGGAAAIFVDVASLDDLAAIGAASSDTGLPVLVIGRGSNMLVADAGFDGIVASIVHLANEVEIEPAGSPSRSARIGGGATLPVAARRTVAAGLTGFEWAVGVPGTIGGAVRMNAGGHGSDMAACLIDVEIFDVSRPSAGMHTVGLDDLGLRFRGSALGPGDVVVAARVQLAPGDPDEGAALISEIVQWRREHQPGGQNCGSVFVNPVPGEVSAGSLIDSIGLKGFTVGSAQVSEKHANFFQATPGGSADDVYRLITTVRAEVERRTGYLLRPEVRLVGFADVDPFSFGEPPSSAGAEAAT